MGFNDKNSAGAGNNDLTVKKDDTTIGIRPILNFHEGSNITLTVTDDNASDEVDVTIASKLAVKKDDTLVGNRPTINFHPGSNITLTVTDDNASDEVDVTIAAGTGASGNIAVAHNNTFIASEAQVDFTDTSSVKWTITDNPGGTEVDVFADVVTPFSKVKTVTAATYNMTNADLGYIVIADAIAGAGTVNLPDISTVDSNFIVTILVKTTNVPANPSTLNVRVQPFTGQDLGDAAHANSSLTFNLSNNGDSITITPISSTRWGIVAIKSIYLDGLMSLPPGVQGFGVFGPNGGIETVTLTAGSSKLSITNGSGNSNPVFDVVQSNLILSSLGGTLGVTQGGSGQTTANAALNAFLPTQTSNANKFLQTDATNTSWVTVDKTVVGLGNVSNNLQLTAANNLSDLASVATAKTNLSLNNVENTALSTWAGSTNITTLGTISTGTVPLANTSGTLPVNRGGTGGTTQSAARVGIGALFTNVATKSANYSIVAADDGLTILSSDASTPITLTLPLTSAVPVGFSVSVSSVDGTNATTVATAGGELINDHHTTFTVAWNELITFTVVGSANWRISSSGIGSTNFQHGSTKGDLLVSSGSTFNGLRWKPAGSNGLPLVADSTNTNGLAYSALGVIGGGTGQTSYTDGQLLIGNSTGNTLTKATLTAGTGISIALGGGSITITATGGLYPQLFRNGAAPVWASTSTFTISKFSCVDSANSNNIDITSSKTINLTTVGLNGIAQSAALSGTVTYTNSSTAVTGSGTTFTTQFVVGDVVYDSTNSQTIGTVASITSNTALVLATAFSGTGHSGAAFKRGGLSVNTFYYLYAISNLTTTGYILSSRSDNVNALTDLPSGYTVYRQLSFACKTDASFNLINFEVMEGWPSRPKIRWNVDLPNISSAAITRVASGVSMNNIYATITPSPFVPVAISKECGFYAYPAGIGNGDIFRWRPTGGSYSLTGEGTVTTFAGGYPKYYACVMPVQLGTNDTFDLYSTVSVNVSVVILNFTVTEIV